MSEKNIKKLSLLAVAVVIAAALGLAASFLFFGAASSEPNGVKTGDKNTTMKGKSSEILEFGYHGGKNDGSKDGKSKLIKKGDTFNFGSKKYVISDVEESDSGHTFYVKVAGEGKNLIKDSSIFTMQLTGCIADTEMKASWLKAKGKQAYYVPAATPDKGSGWLLFSCNKKPAKLIFALGGQKLEFEKKK